MSMPLPPSIETGALTLYWTWLLPAPVRISVSAAVEKPLVSFGSAICCDGVEPGDLAARVVDVGQSPVVSASAKARTTNWSLSSSPSSRSAAWLA